MVAGYHRAAENYIWRINRCRTSQADLRAARANRVFVRMKSISAQKHGY
jgi:hypothetical protein